MSVETRPMSPSSDAVPLRNPAGPGPRSSVPTPQVETEIDLGPYLLALRRRWKAIALTALVAGLAGFGVGSLSPRLYEAAAVLRVVQPPQAQQTGSPLTIPSLKTLLSSVSFATDIVRDAGLDQPPYRFTPRAFVRDALIVQSIPDTDLLRVGVRLSDPDQAAGAAGKLAARAVDLSQRLNEDESNVASGQLNKQLTEAAGRLKAAEQRWLEYRRQVRIDLLKKDVEITLNQRAALFRISVDIERERARLTAAQVELAKQQRILVLARSIDTESLATASATAVTQDPKQALALGLKSEVVNPVYEMLDSQIAQTRTVLAALEEERRRLEQRAKPAETKQLDDLYVKELDLARLEAERDVLKRLYEDLALRYEQTRAEVSGKAVLVQIVEPAIRPDQPLSRGRAQTAALGFILGLAFAAAIVVGGELIRQRSRWRLHGQP